MKSDITIPNSIYQAAENEFDAIQIIQEFNAWDVASDEVLKNFEEEWEIILNSMKDEIFEDYRYEKNTKDADEFNLSRDDGWKTSNNWC